MLPDLKLVPYAPKNVIDSTIVEAITFTNPSASEDELRAQVEKAASLAGCNGVASGFASGGTVDKTFVAIIGWQGLEASKAADKSYAAGAAESHHTNFR